MKSWFFPFFFLFWLFSGQLFSVYLSVSGISVQSGMLQRLITPIAIISYIILVRDLLNQKNPNVKKVLILTIFFAALYLFSSFFEMNIRSEYYTRFLRFASICVAGVAIGIHLAQNPCYEKIDKLLPFFIIIMVYVLGNYGLEAALNQSVIHEEEGEGVGLNYQSFSYYMALAFAECLYFIFFSTIRGTRYHRIMTWPMSIVCVASGVLCLIGGGRGPFLFLVVFVFVFLYFYNRTHKLSLGQIVIFIGLIAVFALLSSRIDIFNTSGFTRVVENMTQDDTRPILYAKAWDAFLSSPILGHGFGSIWWTVGFASHSMILDLLAEGGLIGTFFVLYFIFMSLRYLWRQTKIAKYHFLILLLLVEALVENFVSGYWVSCEAMWFCVAFALTEMKEPQKVLNNIDFRTRSISKRV